MSSGEAGNVKGRGRMKMATNYYDNAVNKIKTKLAMTFVFTIEIGLVLMDDID